VTAANEPPARTVRTQPLIWSPKDPNVLFYATAGVWKTTNGGHSWTAISGDLTRQTWDVPPNAGKYASTVTPSALGTVTAIAPSPSTSTFWAAPATDSSIHYRWRSEVTTSPRRDQAVTHLQHGRRHFDTKTAYAAANTLRLDDMNPHFWRTHDGGKTWTEIDNGIAPGAVANSIREDPRKKGLLYAATDTRSGSHSTMRKLAFAAPRYACHPVRDIAARTMPPVSARPRGGTTGAVGFSTT
jgi:hypothetical protein